MFTPTEQLIALIVFIFFCVAWIVLRFWGRHLDRLMEWIWAKDPERKAFEEKQRKKRAEQDASKSNKTDTD